jgi:hypothetical protein
MAREYTTTYEQEVEAKLAADIVLARYPRLTTQGIGYLPNSKLSTREYLGEIKRFRDDFYDRDGLEQIATAIAWCKQIEKIKTPKYNSYWLKHHAEQWGGVHGLSSYVSNGALIVAADYLGFPIIQSSDIINALIGVSKRSVIAVAPLGTIAA